MSWNEYWAWHDEKGYHHVYPKKALVEMCSPDRFKRATERGEGKVVRVRIEEEELDNGADEEST